MFRTFKIAFLLRNTYKVNGIIYSLKQIPIIKRFLPATLYSNVGLKRFAAILQGIREFFSIFIGKFLYLGLMIVLPAALYKVGKADAFLHMFIFLTLIGGFMNTYMFNPTKDKYYAMILMRMDARKYTLTDYIYAMLKLFIGMSVAASVFALFVDMNVLLALSFPLFAMGMKCFLSGMKLRKYEMTSKVPNENNLSKAEWGTVFLLLAAAYGLPALKITVSIPVYVVIFLVFATGGVWGIWRIQKFESYTELYKFLLVRSAIDPEKIVKDVVEETNRNIICRDEKITSRKTGYEYFHDLFMKRHKKILWKAAKRNACIMAGIFAAVLIGVLVNETFCEKTNELLLTFLPYFVFILYLINPGGRVTKLMFVNCDHSMLTYTFFRQPKAILKLFQIRLKSLALMNLLPAGVIAASLSVLLFVSGGTKSGWDYVILIVSVLAISVFFSVHYLTCYYLLQPYKEGAYMESGTYTIVSCVTYFVCFYCMKLRVDIALFGLLAIAFCLAYCIVACVLVYKIAWKTFKIRN